LIGHTPTNLRLFECVEDESKEKHIKFNFHISIIPINGFWTSDPEQSIF